jgi:hypothetical protein
MGISFCRNSRSPFPSISDIFSIDHFRLKKMGKEARAYIETILRIFPGTTKKTARQFLAIPDDEVLD